jgi:hypothetical protein
MYTADNGIEFFFEQVEEYALEVILARLGPLYNIFLQAGFCSVKNKLVKFSYVGIASNSSTVICILPKYMFREVTKKQDYRVEAGSLIKVLKQYNLNTSTFADRMEFYDDSTVSETNEVALADFLLLDYLNNGIWSYQNKYISADDTNEILWDYTVDQSIPVISKYPYYFEVFSQSNEKISNTIVSRIHQWGIQYSAYRYADILDLQINVDSLESINIEDLGDREFLIDMLSKELRVTFNDRDILLLKTLIELIRVGTTNNKQDYSLYGKNKFEHIWEDALSYNFKNEYKNFAKYISKPEWSDKGSGVITEKNTLRPDVIRWVKDSSRSVVLIIDAKYYLFEFNEIDKNAENNPGVGDIVKQYFYELVLNRPTSSAPWLEFNTTYVNILMYPGQNYKGRLMEHIGSVSLDNSVTNKPIYNFHLNPFIIFENYIKRTPFSDFQIAELADL